MLILKINLSLMKTLLFNLIFCLVFHGISYSQNKSYKAPITKPIIFNDNTSIAFSSNELNMLNEVYGSKLKSQILERPTRILVIKEILRNRVIVEEVSDPKKQKPCPMLSEIPLFDIYVSNLEREAVFEPENFNPLKYNFEFHNPSIQRFRVDNSNYFITIKPQHYNK